MTVEPCLTWQKCPDGYEITSLRNNDQEYFIVPKSNRLESFYPLKSHSALLKQLAGISTKHGFNQFANFNGLLSHPAKPESIRAWFQTANAMRDASLKAEKYDFDQLTEYFNSNKSEFLNIELECENHIPKFVTKIGSLKGGMWWQFTQSLTNKHSFERCSLCFTWFTVGQGTGRRRRTLNTKHSFCSPKHQGRYKYLQRHNE